MKSKYKQSINEKNVFKVRVFLSFPASFSEDLN